jgi:predicted dienelactone hydrolase
MLLLGMPVAHAGEVETGAVDKSEEVSGKQQPSATFEVARIDGIKVAIWSPGDAADKRVPLIVFSHGFTACARNSSFLTIGLAKAGYRVAAPEHRDSACVGGGFQVPEAPFDKPDAWNDGTYRQRGRDLSAVIDGLRIHPNWAMRIDPDRIALMGHSLGGYLALSLAGARPSWQRSDIRAVLALAPLIGPLIKNGELDNIHVPVMYQAGSRDAGTNYLIKMQGGAYDITPDAAYAEFKEANHFAWLDDSRTAERPIVTLSVAFFDSVFKGKTFVLPPGAGVAMFKEK